MGDLAVALEPKDKRSRNSHAVALDLRERLAKVPLPAGATIKVVEAPPGPPVLATLLAEVYGPDAATRRAVAERVKAIFRSASMERSAAPLICRRFDIRTLRSSFSAPVPPIVPMTTIFPSTASDSMFCSK